MVNPDGLTPIFRVRAVHYSTYANLPATGLRVGDLGYATDRLTLYRWSGAAWQNMTIYCSSGLAAAIPAAANLPDGSMYFATDTAVLYQVQSGAWAAITAAGLTICNTVVYNAASPTVWTDLDLSGTIGAVSAVVIMKVYANLILGQWSFRRNGDTDEHWDSYGASNGVQSVAGRGGTLVTSTDSSGIVEWNTANSRNPTVVTLLAYFV